MNSKNLFSLLEEALTLQGESLKDVLIPSKIPRKWKSIFPRDGDGCRVVTRHTEYVLTTYEGDCWFARFSRPSHKTTSQRT